MKIRSIAGELKIKYFSLFMLLNYRAVPPGGFTSNAFDYEYDGRGQKNR